MKLWKLCKIRNRHIFPFSLPFFDTWSRWPPPTGGQMQKSPIVILAIKGIFSQCSSSFNPQHWIFRFGITDTLHHCRACGEGFCHPCSDYKVNNSTSLSCLTQNFLGIKPTNEFTESMPWPRLGLPTSEGLQELLCSRRRWKRREGGGSGGAGSRLRLNIFPVCKQHFLTRPSLGSEGWRDSLWNSD